MGTNSAAGVAQFRSVDPANAILPVLLIDRVKDTIKDLLGTSFFFSARPTILSCAHVLGREPEANEIIAVPVRRLPDAEPGVLEYHDLMAPISNVRRHPFHDLAVADAPGVTHFEHLAFRSSDPLDNTRNMLTYDLASRITFEPGHTDRTITPYIWKGYVHSILISQELGMRAPAKILDLNQRSPKDLIPRYRGLEVVTVLHRQKGSNYGRRSVPIVGGRRRAGERATQPGDLRARMNAQARRGSPNLRIRSILSRHVLE